MNGKYGARRKVECPDVDLCCLQQWLAASGRVPMVQSGRHRRGTALVVPLSCSPAQRAAEPLPRLYLDCTATSNLVTATPASIQYEPDSEAEPEQVMREGAVLPTFDEEPYLKPVGLIRRARWRGKIYDLREFLCCIMPEEGRPSQPQEFVAELEALLYSQRVRPTHLPARAGRGYT